jgi:hypothetical protein
MAATNPFPKTYAQAKAVVFNFFTAATPFSIHSSIVVTKKWKTD